MAALGAGARADLDEPVGGTHHGFVVFDDHHRVALCDKTTEDADHPRKIAGVHADARFVEDEDRVCEAGAEAGRQIDALDFAAGKRARETVEGEVAKSDCFEVAEASEDRFECVVRRVARIFRCEGREQRAQVRDRRSVEFGQGFALPAPEERLLSEAAAVAFRAGFVGAPAREEDAYVHLIARPFQPAEEAADAIPLRIVFALHVTGFAVLDEFAMRGGKFLPRHVERDGRLAASAHEVFLRFAVDVTLERGDGAFGERQGRVRDDLVPVEADDAAEAAALWAGSDG